MEKEIPLMPHLTKETMKGVQDALLQRERADYDCYLVLKRLIDAGLIDLIQTTPWSFERSQVEEDIIDAIERREKANDKFLSLISGRG